MTCPVCPHHPNDPETPTHCRKCHFVHDHMPLLDGTNASNNRLQFNPPPWKLGPTTEKKVRNAWREYEIPTRFSP